MQLTHIRRSDLNLLPALAVLLDERQISKAAERYHLSQPAMSRLLQRLRETFGDELLIKTPQGYELTQRARRIQDELTVLLPALERLLRGDAFEPATAAEQFRLCCPDFASLALAPMLAHSLAMQAPGSSLEILPPQDEVFADLERGRLDVLLWSSAVPVPFLSEPLMEDDLVCVVAANHPALPELTLADYARYPHVSMTTSTGDRIGSAGLLDRHLAQCGIERRIALRVPYSKAAILAVEQTTMIATIPRLAAQIFVDNNRLQIVQPPLPLPRLTYVMIWHPRIENDPAQRWFRRLLSAAINNPAPSDE